MGRSQAFVLDLALVAAATFSALILRDNFETSVDHVNSLVPYLAATLCVSGVVLPAFGVYRTLWRFASFGDGLSIVSAAIAVAIGAVAVGFSFNRLSGVPRSLPILQCLLVIAFMWAVRLAIRLGAEGRPPARAIDSASPPMRTVLVVGLGRPTDLYLRCVDELASGRVRVAGILTQDEREIGCSTHGVRVLAHAESLADTIRTLEVHGVFVDGVVVAMEVGQLSQPARDAIAAIALEGRIRLELLAETMGLALASAPARAGDRPSPADVFALGDEELDRLAARPIWRVKRALDILLSANLLALLAPLMLLVSIGVALDVGLPVAFWQERPGRGGRSFRLRKFRTMRAAHDDDGRRLADDERISRFGVFLRRSRLDELPQLVDILRGEMSFVGPRPLLPVDQPADSRARLAVRPGLTGWAQVKGGRGVSIADKTALDLWYMRNASLALDARVLFETARLVLVGESVDEEAIASAWKELGASSEAPTPDTRRLERVPAAVADAQAPAARDNAA
jgi:lipopolysaccharide/colanic/teichoic acid biosynthesis glycosyltransferase